MEFTDKDRLTAFKELYRNSIESAKLSKKYYERILSEKDEKIKSIYEKMWKIKREEKRSELSNAIISLIKEYDSKK